MLEITSFESFENFFRFPLVTKWNNQRFFDMLLRFTNLCDGRQYTEQFIINKIPDQKGFSNFNDLKPYLSIDDITRLESLLQNVFSQSGLYEHTIHKLDVIMQVSANSNQNNLILTRYFIIPHVQHSESYLVTLPLQINQQSLQYGFSVPKQDLDNNDIISTHHQIIVSTKWSDIIIHQSTEIENKAITGNIKVAGYDMTRVMIVLLGQTIKQDGMHLYGIGSVDKTMILIPQMDVQRGQTYTQDKIKHTPLSIQIHSQVFDGLEYKDYGKLFFQRGFRFRVNGPEDSVAIGVDKKIGSELL